MKRPAISLGVLLAVLLCCVTAAPSRAVVPFAQGGYDSYSGPGGQTTRSATVTGGAALGGAIGALTVSRFDDSFVGMGDGYTGMLGVPVGPATSLRAWGSRVIGDGSYRAWRAKAGPRFASVAGSSLGLYYLHYEDRSGVKSDGGSAEAEVPVVRVLTARASGGAASAPTGGTSEQALVGVGWHPMHGLEISGDAGAARNGTLAFSPGPAPLPVLPILGIGGSGSGTTSTHIKTEGLFQIGLRVMLP